jgi:hypothetical protein
LTSAKFLFLTYIQDTDPHSFSKLDPDPHSPEKPDPHKVNADPKHWVWLFSKATSTLKKI